MKYPQYQIAGGDIFGDNPQGDQVVNLVDIIVLGQLLMQGVD